MINTCISELKKKKDFFQDIDDKDFVAESDHEDTHTEYDIYEIEKAIQSLSEGYRVIFTMYAIEGYDHQEIAQVMNISEGTSKSQYSRAKSRLKELLKNPIRKSNIS